MVISDLSGKVEDVSKVQTLLFSATLPDWVKQVIFVYICDKISYPFDSFHLYAHPKSISNLICSHKNCVSLSQISTKFLKRDKKTVDLVGNQKMKASTNVRHIVLPCTSNARSQLIPDIIRCYSRWVVYYLPLSGFQLNVVSNICGAIPVEAEQLYSQRQRSLHPSLQACCLVLVLFMVTYNSHNERQVLFFYIGVTM